MKDIESLNAEWVNGYVFYDESGHKLFKGLNRKKGTQLYCFAQQLCAFIKSLLFTRLLSLFCCCSCDNWSAYLYLFNCNISYFSFALTILHMVYMVNMSSPNWNNTANGIEMIISCVSDWKIAIKFVSFFYYSLFNSGNLRVLFNIISIKKAKQHAIKSFTSVHILRRIVFMTATSETTSSNVYAFVYGMEYGRVNSSIMGFKFRIWIVN